MSADVPRSHRAAWRRYRHVLPLALLLGAFGAGILPCHWLPAGGAPPAAHAQGQHQAQAPHEVRVTLTEWALIPARISVPAGRTIRFLAVNAGVLPHAIAVEGDGISVESDTVGAGQVAPLEIVFAAAGTYDIFCPVGDGQHRVLGQEGIVVVQPLTAGLLLPRTGNAALDEGVSEPYGDEGEHDVSFTEPVNEAAGTFPGEETGGSPTTS